MKQNNRFKGFTLIELLVTIAIIAILSTVAITIFTGVQKKGRITKRVNDLKAIQAALELYKSENGFYPKSTNPNADQLRSECPQFGNNSPADVIPGLIPTYLQTMPADPSMDKVASNSCYIYYATKAGNEYKLMDHRIPELSNADYLSKKELIDPVRDGGVSNILIDPSTVLPCPAGILDGSCIWAWAVYSTGGIGF